jgi:glycosyltransferase involved in cell wall biosynthesis
MIRLLLVADGRSPITLRWIAMLHPLKYHITVLSSYPCKPIPGVEALYILPIAFSQQSGSQAGNGLEKTKKGLVARFRPMAQRLRYWFGPLTIPARAEAYIQIVEAVKPDLVHAMRVPFEGMLASYTPAGIPLVVSTWGNDLTLHAPAALRMSSLTRRALSRTDALITDVQRDIRLAWDWGFNTQKPTLVVPGNGGLDLEEMQKAVKGIQKADPPQVINPRGMRSYVRSDTFFKAIPLVLEKHPEVKFVCASMEGQVEALEWVHKLGIENNVTLLPFVSQKELWREFAKSDITLSISAHDGTPNSLLEAMAFGCLPICGDIESIREWITPGENGLLVNPSDPKMLAAAILGALDNSEFRAGAATRNAKLVLEQATIENIRIKVQAFYERLLQQ